MAYLRRLPLPPFRDFIHRGDGSPGGLARENSELQIEQPDRRGQSEMCDVKTDVFFVGMCGGMTIEKTKNNPKNMHAVLIWRQLAHRKTNAKTMITLWFE